MHPQRRSRISHQACVTCPLLLALLCAFGAIITPQAAGATGETYLTQWATSVIDFSSQWASNSWAATQALGEPNTFTYGDISTAWAASPQNGTIEYIAVGYDTPVYADGAVVRETYGNGAVFQIDALDTSGDALTVWSGVDPTLPGEPAEFEVTWGRTSYLVSGLRVWVDGDHDLDAWEEIDAIQLLGSPDTAGTGTEASRRFTYEFPAGPSLFALALDPVFFAYGSGFADVNSESDGPMASHLVELGATVVAREVNDALASAIGRDGVIAFGSDFPLELGTAYIVNMLEPTTVTLGGETPGVPLLDALMKAPDGDTPASSPGLFAVGITLDEAISVPNGMELHVRNGRTGVDAIATSVADRRFGVTLAGETDDSLVQAGDTLTFAFVTREGLRLPARNSHRVTDRERAYASVIARVDPRPVSAALLPNYPNPFNPETWMPFSLTAAADVTIRIYDVHGAVVRTLGLGRKATGHHV
ncbi:hypothetical protein HOK31_23350, partial [Candidatus Poribacteria bacterium]|nr:hypothetical protein [Candidatus Poribacteria bacterium]